MDFLSYSLFWKGLLSAVLIAISTAIIGVFLMVKRLAMLGAGLSHAAFGGVAIAIVLGIEPLTFTLIYTILVSFLLQFIVDKRRLPADTVVALLFSLGVAVAVILLSMTDNLGTGLFSYLFGSMLTATEVELLLSLSVCIATLLFVLINYRSLLLLSFNEEIARLRGVRVGLLNYALVAIASANIVLSIKAVGLILSASLLSIPPMTAFMLAQSFLQSLILSISFSLTSIALGILMSFLFDLPPGASAVSVMAVFFALVGLFKLTGKRFSKAS